MPGHARGPADLVAGVDATGRVRQVAELLVAAFIFPEAISTPSNLTVLRVAERVAAALRRPAQAAVVDVPVRPAVTKSLSGPFRGLCYMTN